MMSSEEIQSSPSREKKSDTPHPWILTRRAFLVSTLVMLFPSCRNNETLRQQAIRGVASLLQIKIHAHCDHTHCKPRQRYELDPMDVGQELVRILGPFGDSITESDVQKAFAGLGGQQFVITNLKFQWLENEERKVTGLEICAFEVR